MMALSGFDNFPDELEALSSMRMLLEKNLKISKKNFKMIKKDIFQKKYRGVTKVSCGI